AGELLDRTSFDLLPFVLLVKNKELRPAYTLTDEDPELIESRDRYSRRLQQALDEDELKEFRAYRPMKLLEIVDAKVPADAFDKVRRRFRLLDRGPARARCDQGGNPGG